MKIVFIAGLSFLMSLLTYLVPVQKPQASQIVLCHAPSGPNEATHNMAQMAADPAFQQLHENPLPFSYKGAGEMVKFSTPDGQSANGFLLKSKNSSNKWLLVYQEWWGLNDNIKQ